MNVSAWCIRNPIPSVLLFIMLSLGGLMGFKAMKVQQFPDIDLPTVTVTASLPGAAPAQLETEVARKIENSIASVQGLKHIYTKLQDGSATITAEFRLEKPTQQAVDDVRDAVSRVRSDLPADMRDPVIAKMELSGAPILTYPVASSRLCACCSKILLVDNPSSSRTCTGPAENSNWPAVQSSTRIKRSRATPPPPPSILQMRPSETNRRAASGPFITSNTPDLRSNSNNDNRVPNATSTSAPRKPIPAVTVEVARCTRITISSSRNGRGTKSRTPAR